MDHAQLTYARHTCRLSVQALVSFFNNTCTEAQESDGDASNPYRGAFAQVSQWRQQKGWSSIVKAHSDVAVQCRGLYMEGGEEFTAKHCFWNIQSLANATVYPSPQWTIVETCCEQLDRPVLRVSDAVWATTRGSPSRIQLHRDARVPALACFYSAVCVYTVHRSWTSSSNTHRPRGS